MYYGATVSIGDYLEKPGKVHLDLDGVEKRR
jgi:hypothetical protein